MSSIGVASAVCAVVCAAACAAKAGRRRQEGVVRPPFPDGDPHTVLVFADPFHQFGAPVEGGERVLATLRSVGSPTSSDRRSWRHVCC
ncbi:hypothetical protein [Streptomyces sp. NBC_01012]|uniref:hypothetical protein n=1 Tax=Streptomyces sp. NBC_01012 TaxID=2903717 RepID=UPI00386D15E4|nr:hypothetical protein OG623_02025 [Streptomyces sp. NBC_01012]